MQLKNAERWAVVKEGRTVLAGECQDNAERFAALFTDGATVIPCRLVPVDDLSRLVRAASNAYDTWRDPRTSDDQRKAAMIELRDAHDNMKGDIQ